MKTSTLKHNVSASIGWLCTIPTLYFIFIFVLKYAFWWPASFDVAVPTLEAWGIKETIGGNVNLLLLFGPLLTLLNLISVVQAYWHPGYRFYGYLSHHGFSGACL